MRIIDANSGTEVKVGSIFRNVNGLHRLLKVNEGLLTASVLMEVDGELVNSPLQVRYTHPDFFLQKVAFIPS